MDLHLKIDRSAGHIAAQLAAELRDAIRTGRMEAGAKLPASRDLAGDLGLSRGVVVEAYEQLVAEGFLLSRQGSGTRVSPRLVRGTPPVARGGPKVPEEVAFDLRPGTPDLASFPRREWLAATRQVLHDLPHEELGYPDLSGVAELRAELAAYLRRVRAAEALPQHVVIVGGVAHGLSVIAGELVRQGREVLAVEDPCSARQKPLLQGSGATLAGVPVDDEGLDVDALSRTAARAVMVTPAHQYPTGVVLSPRRRTALIEWAHDVDGLIIEDDYDAELRYDREPVGCLQGLAPDRVILAGSVSKALAPGLRLGWLVAPAFLAEIVRHARFIGDLGSPVLPQCVLARLIRSGGYDRHLRAMRRRYRSRRDALVTALGREIPGCRVYGVSAGLHLYVELPPSCDEEAVVKAAAERGVAVDGLTMMRSGPGVPALALGYARLSERRIAEAVGLLAQAVRSGD